MKELIDIADQLNTLLSAEQLDKSKLDGLVRELDQISDLRVKLVDFEKYNEEALAKLTEEKMAQIRSQNFEQAATLREQEKECIKYANFQRYFKLKNSFFYPEERKLFYFHLGTERNDEILKEFFAAVI
ncbi:hypothetical protein [Sunxiuqinia sp. sy24]|uniref:hypothetical protein n=1 Tax=Sunxiuqinia sp. sy24 TaxID=3461495 RepID=UPI0040460896